MPPNPLRSEFIQRDYPLHSIFMSSGELENNLGFLHFPVDTLRQCDNLSL